MTLQASEQWLGMDENVSTKLNLLTWVLVLDVYKAASEQNVIVVGGHARTVGSAGGYLTGGRRSPFAYFYGLAVDSEFLLASKTLPQVMLI